MNHLLIGFSSGKDARKCFDMMYCYWLVIVQIVLESFPISSSAHSILLQQLLQRMGGGIISREASCAFFEQATLFDSDVLAHWAHGPTVVIVPLFFASQWFFLVRHMQRCWRIIAKIIFYTALADMVTAIFFILFHMIGNAWFPVSLGLIITFLCLYSLAYVPRQRSVIWDWRTALFLGLAQGCALLPGISRMAITYTAARWIGFVPRKSFEISLLIQWPLIFAAWCNSIRVLRHQGMLVNCLQPMLLISMVCASIVAWYGLRFTYYCFLTNRERWFAWYLLIPIGLWIWLFATAYTL